MKSAILSSTIAISCALLASGAPTLADSADVVVARAGIAGKIIGAAEKSLDRMAQNEMNKTKETVKNWVTGGGGSSQPKRHPELHKIIQKNLRTPKIQKKRDLDDELEVRDFTDDELEEIFARGLFSKIFKAGEKSLNSGKPGMAQDNKDKSKHSIKDYVTGKKPSQPHRHPELDKTIQKNLHTPKIGKKKRDFVDYDLEELD